MIKKICYKTLLVTVLLVMILQPYLASFSFQTAKAADDLPDDDLAIINLENDDPGPDPGTPNAVEDPTIAMAHDLDAQTIDSSNTFSSNVANKYTASLAGLGKSKIIFSASDQQDLRILSCLGNVIPDFANHDDVLATATGKTIAQIVDLKNSNSSEYKKLIDQAQERARVELVTHLRTDLPNFACIAGVDETQAAEMMRYDQESVNAIIDYAQNKIVIDRRVLELLVNLVTPKNVGGAGHERIKVYRLRSGYDRDARMMSRESDAIREDISQRQQSELNTVGDVSSANRDQLDANQQFAGAEAQAAVVDSAGRSQGDLIFYDKESDVNLSAHSRGEAVDISEVDNVKCTLIKKRRVGGDKKTAQPATPIKLAWQTTEGYDRSPPPDYSSLQMNLRQMASGQYLDMLDELGIDPDSETDLSGASFADIIGLVGESLVAEILNSPTNSLSGYSLSDTVKKIGGIILADKLALPRAPFVEADFANLNDLKVKVGEAVLEKKLNIPYGSLRGANLDEMLRNVGLRYVEQQVGAPRGSISSGMSAEELKLSIGRRTIESKLRLPPGTFKADTSYKNLQSAGGQRKIDLIFTNPSEVDEILGIDYGYSSDYKAGVRSPDSYATIVGAKVLSDNAYIYSYNSSSANALRMDIDPNVGSESLNPSQSNASLSNTTTTAQARFNSIMSGTLTNVPNPSFDDLYKSIGIETLSVAFSTNSEVRAALTQWMTLNSTSSQTNCSIPTAITVSIPKPGSTTGELKDVTLPEDQFMSTFGLRRGDLSRLLGCFNVTPASVFSGLGEKTLYEAVLNSSDVQQAERRFLADNPQIGNFLADVEFYRSRIATIQNLANKLKNDWSGASSNNQELQARINDIRSSSEAIVNRVGGINISGLNLSNIGSAVLAIQEIPSAADRIMAAVGQAQGSGDQSLIARANSSLSDISSIVQAIDEILSGQAQPAISTISIGNLSTGSFGVSGVSINRATLTLMLAGRLSPKDFLISLGSGTIENSLNLPSNSMLYFAKYLDSPAREANDLKAAFFRSIGQAGFEETFNMPPFFFQGDYPAKSATLTDVKIHIARSFNISEAEAGARIMQALSLPGEFSTIERQKISSISSVVLAARNMDTKLAISDGTTANFLNGDPVKADLFGNTDIRMLAGAFNIPEQVIKKFLHVRRGDETLDQARQANFASEVSYNPHNEFAPKQAANAGSNLSDQCPIAFNFDLTTKTFSSQFIQDSSYISTNRDGTRSFPSLSDARNYEKTVAENKKVDFTQALAIGIEKGKGNANPSDDQINQTNNKLVDFLNKQNSPEAFPDTDLVAMADSGGIPIDTLRDIFTREEITGAQANAKPIGFYLEVIGQKTAQHRVVSALLGGLTMTFGGLGIDATDIFDILSGNGMQVAYRIGGRFLEQHFNISPNLVMAILEAPNQILKNCSLAKIGGNLLGSVLGVGSVSLSGNIYENIGGAKVEQALGLPAMSFRGANVDELISSLGASKFADVFDLPVDIVAPASVTSTVFGSQIYQTTDPMSAIDTAFVYPDSMPNATNAALSDAQTSLDRLVRQFIHDPSIWNQVQDPNSSQQNFQLAAFQRRVSYIDGLVGVSAGSTKKMLTGEGGYSPDKYRRDAANGVLLTNAANILTALGLGDFANMIVAGVALATRFQETIDGIKACANARSTSCNRVALYNNLQMILGVSFDAKLGLPAGTIATIIADPQQAAFHLIQGALARLDDSLGLVGDDGRPLSNASFSYAFQVWFNNDYRNCDTNPANCLTNNNNDTVSTGFLQSESRWQYVVRNIGDQLVGNFLNRIGMIEIPHSPTSGPYSGFPSTQALIRQSADMLIHGDLRILAVSAAIKAAEALHIYNDSTDPNLPAAYRISFEDVYYAIMGNPILEQQYVDAATQNFLYEYSQGNTPSPSTIFSNDNEMANGNDPIYASQCYPGGSTANCANANVVGFVYSFYDNSQSFANAPAHQPTGTAPDGTLQQVLQNPNASQSLRGAQEYARSQARRDMRNNLLWRMADAQLYQLDPNIPVGFARTMFSGTGKQRTMMLLLYAANAFNLSEIKIGGISVGDIASMLPIIREAISFFQNPAGFNLDDFVSSGHMATLDGWLNTKFSNFLGFDLAPGTFTSLFYGLKTGNFVNDQVITIGGQERTIQSITHLYTDWAISKITAWADKALGLPPGTIFTAYKMYQGIQAAQVGIAAAANGVTNAEMALETAQHAGDAAGIEAAQNNLNAANGKLNGAKANVTAMKAELISFIVTTVFAKQIAAAETALGLVPGTGGILISAAISFLMTGAIPWIGLAMFVLMNLFGVYKVEVICSADGYYPRLESPPDPSVYDNGNLGEFNAMKEETRKSGYINAARYKAQTLAGDALKLSERTGDPTAIPSQIMVGRQNDVDYWKYKTEEVICSKIGGCDGTRAGIWFNPQTTAYTHIGF